jgi:NADH:ubiquinone oxidoreductase subunit F (NADH-binding)
MWGLLPQPGLPDLIAASERMGLLGAGGAGFPTARKLASVGTSKPGPVVVNGSEGESASGKDTVLLTHVPHLVLDGAVASARALGARKILVRIPASRVEVQAVVQRAIAERHDRGLKITISRGADTFIAGEASAVVSSLQGGPALPTPMSKPPTIRKSAVMLSNVETFARLALAARGHSATSSLVTVSGAVLHAGVMEVDPSTPIGEVLRRCQADPSLSALITGGWHGTWLPASPAVLSIPINRAALREAGAHFGAGAFIALPNDPCPVDVLMAVTDYLLGAGAGQCGPCVLGMAAARRDLLQGQPVRDRVQRRGLCAHPTATIAALQSGHRLLEAELGAHAAGRCEVTP